MPDVEVITPEQQGLDTLAGSVLANFYSANNARNQCGATSCLQRGYIRSIAANSDMPFSELIKLNSSSTYECEDCDTPQEQEPQPCDPDKPDVCSINELTDSMQAMSPFDGIAGLLTLVKRAEFIALVTNAYAEIGDKPFKLKPSRDASASEQEQEVAAKDFYAYLENFLSENQVRVHEITDAFDLSTLGEVMDALVSEAKASAKDRMAASIIREEAVLERVFRRSHFMREYLTAIEDTADYPVGVLWVDDNRLTTEYKVSSGVPVPKQTLQATASRINPCHFWAGNTSRRDNVGKAYFRVDQYSYHELNGLLDKKIITEPLLRKNLTDLLQQMPNGFRDNELSLFSDFNSNDPNGFYDLLVGRAYYSVADLLAIGVSVPKQYTDGGYAPCETYMLANELVRVRVIDFVDEHLGVYTTTFRYASHETYGIPLVEFIHPFAKLFEGAIKNIDKGVGNSVRNIISIDRGVVDDPGKYLKQAEDGSYVLDLTEDMIVEFDSTDVFNPNFKGTPIHVTGLNSNLNELTAAASIALQYLELFSGIPNILVNTQNIPSALRTTRNYNAAFQASAKVVKSLLRDGETNVLKPAIWYIFMNLAMQGQMKDFLISTEAEILLSDTLTREVNDDQNLLEGVATLSQLGQGRIPEDRIAALINTVGREVFDLEDDLIPGVSALSTNPKATQVAPV